MRFPLILAGLALPACGGSPYGIWLVQLEPIDPADMECEEVVTHNFTDAYVPEDEEEGGLVTEESASESPTIFFVEIQPGADGALLVTADAVYPGTKQDDGSWLFSWTGSEDTDESTSYETLYTYTASTEFSRTLSFQLSFDGDSLSGTLSQAEVQDASYSETDTWPQDLAQSNPKTGEGGEVGTEGRIPSGRYLVKDNPMPKGPDTVPATNTWDAQDCDSSPCTLQVQSSCTASTELVGWRTDFEGGDFDGIQDSRQQAGAR